jgi:hypothetical protein
MMMFAENSTLIAEPWDTKTSSLNDVMVEVGIPYANSQKET